jgi:Aspartyl protease/Tetratricopeptide repeat
MTSTRRTALFILLALSIHASAQSAPPGLASAAALFRSGRFAEARDLYAQIAGQDPQNASAAAQLGHIALLSNQLDDAQKWLEKALALKPADVDSKIMLAEVLYRRNEFAAAAAALAGLGPGDAGKLKLYSTLNPAKLASFKGQIPYELRGEGETTRLKFVKSEPLPLVRVRVNGSPEAIFFIDTGGSELLLDAQFAAELGVKVLGAVEGTFSGGQHAQVTNGRIDSLTLGGWTAKNVPVGMIPLRSLSEGFGVKRLDGCVGTNVLYQFLSTIDYSGGELVLRRKTAANLRQFDAAAKDRNIVVPIWLAGDHFMLAWGRIQTIPPALFFIDSGLAGAGVKLAESVIKEATITLEHDKATEGQGGGGSFQVVPYVVPEVSLGDVHEKNVSGLYDGPFPWENAWGFHVAGMVGHDFLKPYAVTFDFVGMRMILR